MEADWDLFTTADKTDQVMEKPEVEATYFLSNPGRTQSTLTV